MFIHLFKHMAYSLSDPKLPISDRINVSDLGRNFTMGTYNEQNQISTELRQKVGKCIRKLVLL